MGLLISTPPLFDEQATRKNIIESLNSLSTLLLPDDQIIIYFAGHGSIHPKTKKGYWIPTDASDSIGDYIPNSTVIDFIEGIEAKHILLISDSCFSGTFLTQTRAVASSHYEKLISNKSRWVFASGRDEVVSDGQPGVGSPFAVALTNFLESNKAEFISVSELIVFVSKEAGEITKQQPIFGHIEGVGHEGGQMVFSQIEKNKKETISEVDSDLFKILISFETAEILRDIGLPQKSVFGYYELNGKPVIRRNDKNEGFICSAFLFDEIIEFIPEEVEIDENTYVAKSDGYKKVTERDLDYPFAVVSFQRTGSDDNDYMSICRFKGRMVAFSIDSDGKYNNLIRWGYNQAESAALMLIALFEERKVKNNKDQ
jgi:uncharacterized protein (DUF427 family)